MPVLKHIHTYGRWMKRGDEMQYKCLVPKCTHYMPRSLLIGKLGLCSICGEEVIMDWKQLQRAKSLCLKCQNTKEGKAYRQNIEKANTLLNELKILENVENVESKGL